jgi:hypothetical protein
LTRRRIGAVTLQHPGEDRRQSDELFSRWIIPDVSGLVALAAAQRGPVVGQQEVPAAAAAAGHRAAPPPADPAERLAAFNYADGEDPRAGVLVGLDRVQERQAFWRKPPAGLRQLDDRI